MNEHTDRRKQHFDAGIRALIEANETEVIPETKTEGPVTVALLIVTGLALAAFISGVFVNNGFHLLSALAVVAAAILGRRMLLKAHDQLQEMHDERVHLIREKREKYCEDSKVEAHYVLRYLEPGFSGAGTIVKTFAAADPTFDQIEEWWPGVLDKPGFYTLMRATGQTKTVDKKKDNPDAT